MKRRISLLIALLLGGMLPLDAREVGVVHLTCEGRENPLAIDTRSPRFGWQLRSPVRNDRQHSYRIRIASDSLRLANGEADVWDSGKRLSDRSVMVPYEGAPLTDGAQYWWQVELCSESSRRSILSPIARFGVGLTDPASITGRFIGRSGAGATASLLRKRFRVERSEKQALLHVNSLGYHEVWLNGRKVGDACLAPAISQLDKRSLWVTYDVAGLLHEGMNDLVIWLGQGWYKRNTFGRWQPDEPYTEPLVRAQLDAGSGETRHNICYTDSTWRSSLSGYRDTGSWNALDFGGEEVDARKNPRSMDTADLDALDWGAVLVAEKPGLKATPQSVENDRIQERLKPRTIRRIGADAWQLDFGKVITGWLEMVFDSQPAGSRVVFEYSDEVDDKGVPLDQKQRDLYIACGRRGERFINKFNHHAFRHVIVRGLSGEPLPEQAQALAIRTDYRDESTFVCSDSDLNAIHDMIRHTLSCLAYNGYMVDCPHLERSGYGGDGNSSTETLQTMYGVAPLYRNWMQAWSDAMRPGGSLPHVAPNAGAGGGGPYWCGFIVMAPWQTWLNYGDRTLIDRHYPAMKEWISYAERYVKEGLLQRWPDTPYRDWYLGDWLAPWGVDTGNEASVTLVNNCFLSDCYDKMARMARLCGHETDAKRFEKRKAELNQRIHTRFYNPETATYATASQLDMVYPMVVGATPDSLRERVTETLLHRSREVLHDHIGGGLVGVPLITRWAIESRHPEWIYRMLKQRDYPGYLHMIDHGATATWEYWSGERSRVHNCYNGIGAWFYQALGGLRTESEGPGYRHVRIDPQIPEGVEWSRITKETPYGRIKLSWKQQNGCLEMELFLPPGVEASAIVPSGTIAGRLDRKKIDPSSRELLLGSGHHRIVYNR